jgi:hypothetical protein
MAKAYAKAGVPGNWEDYLLTRRLSQWAVMGDFMWASFCNQWIIVAWCMLIGKE